MSFKHIASPGTLLAHENFELYDITIGKRSITITYNCRIVDENIIATALRFDESPSFPVVEELHLSAFYAAAPSDSTWGLVQPSGSSAPDQPESRDKR